jgi:large subunit ribosomal protein L2
MPLVKVKPTSPGRRAVVKVVHPDLYKGRPLESLTESQSKKAGRNNNGHITTRHQGGGHKQQYRMVDFKRNKDGIAAKIERIEYDPNRSAHIALLCYADGERRYIIAPKGVQLLAREGSYAQLRLRSGEIRKVHVDCKATIGEVGNSEHNLRSIGKAGAMRWRGVRPTVRGVVMNPVDHPHGGGEGKTAAGRQPVSPWGVQTKGYRTRRNKRTTNMIVRRRYKK